MIILPRFDRQQNPHTLEMRQRQPSAAQGFGEVMGYPVGEPPRVRQRSQVVVATYGFAAPGRSPNPPCASQRNGLSTSPVVGTVIRPHPAVGQGVGMTVPR